MLLYYVAGGGDVTMPPLNLLSDAASSVLLFYILFFCIFFKDFFSIHLVAKPAIGIVVTFLRSTYYVRIRY